MTAPPRSRLTHTPLPDSFQEPKAPPGFIDTIVKIAKETYSPRKSPLFSFETTPTALRRNAAILEHFEFDLEKAMPIITKGTQLEPGSEFRPVQSLEPLLSFHPNWPLMKKNLEEGATFPLEPLDAEVAQEDLEKQIDRGNHKGATSDDAQLQKLLASDIEQGRALPIPLETATKIKGGVMAPLNIQDQMTIDVHGNRVPKKRLSHDQTWPGQISSTSINSRTIKEKLPPLIYGHMFKRHIHMIHAMRQMFPLLPILISKFDFDAAYRRLHLSWKLAAACLCACLQFALIFLRLTFGGAACPPMWCNAAETITDLSNDIMNCTEWNPEVATAEFTEEELPEPKLEDPATPFEPALPADVAIQVPRYATADDFIDDIVTLCVHMNENWKRASQAVLLAMYLVARPTTNDPIPRKPFLSLKKWIAEGTPEEVKVVLGWTVNTRTMQVSLPNEKHKEWTAQIKHLLKKGKAHKNTWNSITGRLTRVGEIIPTARYFLNNIRACTTIAERNQYAFASQAAKQDLELWLQFLDEALLGFPINNLIYRQPSHIYWADSWPKGLGGYSARGRAWRFVIPDELQVDNVNNVLEFLASTVCILLDLYEKNIPALACLLSCSDSTSTVGWLHRANFDTELRPIHDEIARTLASKLIENKCCLYSQHQRGIWNVVADLLSRLYFLTDSQLTLFLRHNFGEQLPSDFQVTPLPQPIISWITSTLQKLKKLKLQQQKQKKRKRQHSDTTSNGFTESDYKAILTSEVLADPSKSESSEVLQWLSKGQKIITNTRETWLKARSERPLDKWLRPFATTMSQTQD